MKKLTACLFAALMAVTFIACDTAVTGGSPSGNGNGSGTTTTYAITLAGNIEHGTVRSDKVRAAQGDTVTLTATPQDGYQFGEWNVTDSDGTAITVTGGAFTMPAKDVTVSATFTQRAPDTYSISITGGSATNNNQTVASITAGATITITANAPEAGKVFDSWTTTTEGVTFSRATASTTTFVMPANNVSITATYSWIEYTVTYTDGVSSAAISVPTDSATYHKGETVTVMFNGIGTRDSYTFAGWSDGSTTYTSDGTKTFTMGTANVTLTAQWTVAVTPYTFHDTPVILPAGTDGSNGTGSTYVYFGDYPQDVLSRELEAQLTFDESNAIKRGGLTYIPASDGNYYVHICTKTPYSGNYCPKYIDGSYVENDSWRYFKVMPIKWRVLTNTYDVDGTSGSKKGHLLVAESILDANVPFYIDNIWRNQEKDQPSNYESSQIRAFLNGLSFYNGFGDSYKAILNQSYVSKGFLQTAFSTSARKEIITTHVDNSAAQKLGTSEGNQGQDNGGICNDTDDKIFLLSSKEWTDSDYGFGAFSDRVRDVFERNNRQRYPTDFAYARYAGFRPSYPGDHYTRTPTYRYNGGQINYCFVDKVLYDGRVYSGANINNPDVDTSTSGRDTGIVPALCIDLNYNFKGTSWICDLGNGNEKKIEFTTDTVCKISTFVDGSRTGFTNATYTVTGLKTVKIKPQGQTQSKTATVNDSTSPHTLRYSDTNGIYVFVKQ